MNLDLNALGTQADAVIDREKADLEARVHAGMQYWVTKVEQAVKRNAQYGERYAAIWISGMQEEEDGQRTFSTISDGDAGIPEILRRTAVALHIKYPQAQIYVLTTGYGASALPIPPGTQPLPEELKKYSLSDVNIALRY